MNNDPLDKDKLDKFERTLEGYAPMSGFERQLVKGILFRNGNKPFKKYEKHMEGRNETTPATAHENLELEHLEVNVKSQKPEFETSIYYQEDI